MMARLHTPGRNTHLVQPCSHWPADSASMRNQRYHWQNLCTWGVGGQRRGESVDSNKNVHRSMSVDLLKFSLFTHILIQEGITYKG